MTRLVCLMMVAWSADAEEPTGTKLPAVTLGSLPVSGKINQEKADAATVRAQALLSKEPEDSFRPSLSKLRRWVSTLAFRDPRQ